jgi:hypothetical protein
MKETMIETEVTYTLEHGGEFYIIEEVPAQRVLTLPLPSLNPCLLS